MHINNINEQKSFFDDVFAVVQQIPYGRVSTYGAIANYVETATARMVGWAMNKSFSSENPVPAHRVVNRKGELTGRHHFASPTMMQELLENEGIVIEKNRIVDFKKHFWNPTDELPEND